LKVEFTCKGHPNISAKHNRTIELTKDTELTERGDCIIGVACDFDADEIRKLRGKLRVDLKVGDQADHFKAYANPEFDSDDELVFRKTQVRTDRTLGVHLSKSSAKLSRDLIEAMKDPNAVLHVTIESKKEADNG
jgi:hypothetical protein